MSTQRILLIGTDQEFCQPVSTTLGGLGYGVDVAYDGRTGVFLAGRRVYSHTLVEHELEGDNGVQLFRQIQRLQQNVIGILVAAAANLNTVHDALSAGMRRVLARPVDYDQLLPILQHKEYVMLAPTDQTTGFDEQQIAELSLFDIRDRLSRSQLVDMIRSVDYPFAGKDRLEYFDRDTLERVAHLVCRWCRQRHKLAHSA